MKSPQISSPIFSPLARRKLHSMLSYLIWLIQEIWLNKIPQSWLGIFACAVTAVRVFRQMMQQKPHLRLVSRNMKPVARCGGKAHGCGNTLLVSRTCKAATGRLLIVASFNGVLPMMKYLTWVYGEYKWDTGDIYQPEKKGFLYLYSVYSVPPSCTQSAVPISSIEYCLGCWSFRNISWKMTQLHPSIKLISRVM